MSRIDAIWSTPRHHLAVEAPDQPILYFAPSVLQATYRRFAAAFPGVVTFAVKANDTRVVIENLAAAGMRAFDVASPFEMRLVRSVLPDAVLHYHNPVRSRDEIATGVAFGVTSWSVDSFSELEKLAGVVPQGAEIAVRFKLPVVGAAYDFGAKFGAGPDKAAELLRRAAQLGFVPSLTFHPGTQCVDPAAWEVYIREAAHIAASAGVRLARLNVGGGFAAHRIGEEAPDLEGTIRRIADAVADAFGAEMPALVCEPGRAMVAESMTLATRIKAIREDGTVFLNDGIYGALAEALVLGNSDRIVTVGPDGQIRTGAPEGRTVFGPTCDSLDRLPGALPLPGDAAEGDWVLFRGMGAYSTATVTRFNGYGDIGVTTVHNPL
jgi:ornithine decarboxylase